MTDHRFKPGDRAMTKMGGPDNGPVMVTLLAGFKDDIKDCDGNLWHPDGVPYNTNGRPAHTYGRLTRVVIKPALAQALALPEVEEMRKVLERMAAWDHCWPGNIDLDCVAADARAALAALNGGA